MKLSDAVTDFLRFLQHEQGASKQTCICYKSYLTSLLEWYQENGYPDPALSDLNTASLRRYLYHCAERGLRPRTLRGRFHPIKALAVFLVNNGAIKENPTTALTLPKLDAAERLTVSDAEVSALLEACERQRNAFRIALCRAVLSVLVFSGLRRQECLDLRVSDFHAESQSPCTAWQGR